MSLRCRTKPFMQRAEKPYRAINYLIDVFVISLIMAFITWVDGYHSKFLSWFVFFLYYLLFEITTQRTFGKMITKTYVVGPRDEKPSVRAIILRTVCRFFYLDLISFLLGTYGIHDGYSKTRVIRKK